MKLRSIRAALLAVCLAAAVSAPASAQQYPTHTITMLVGFPPSGVLDWMGRVTAAKLQERWGQPVIVENRIGAGGLISLQAAQKAPPDGHTLVVYTDQVSLLPLFVKGADIEPGRNLQPLVSVFYAPYIIITNPQVPAKNLREFIAHVKANPGKLNFALVPQTGAQLDAIAFAKAAGLDIAMIPYQGGVPALRALFANESQLYLGAPLGMDGNVKAGRVTPLAVTDTRRFATLPDIPTVKEAGGFDFVATVDFGYFTTQSTPRPVVDKLSREITDIMQAPDMREQILKQGYEPIAETTDEWLAKMTAGLRRATGIANAAGVKPQ